MMKNLHKLFKNYIYLLPIIQIVITFIIYMFEINYIDWVLIGNTAGYSIITSLVYVGFFCFNSRFCLFTKISCLGLFLISLFNSFSSIFIDDYSLYENIFSKIISSLVIILTIILTIRKTLKNDKNNT